MTRCDYCGGDTVGRSPTGDWCNRCGWMYPCPCDQNRACPYHGDIAGRRAKIKGPVHEHVFIGKVEKWGRRCAVEDCPAGEMFQPGWTGPTWDDLQAKLDARPDYKLPKGGP